MLTNAVSKRRDVTIIAAKPELLGRSERLAKSPNVRGDVIVRSMPRSSGPSGAGHGFGFGITAGGSAEIGLVAGAGATASGGVGAFFDPRGAARVGAFGTGGAFAGIGSRVATAPSGGAAGAVGAFLGLGIGAFATNARSAAELAGVEPTYSVNVGEGIKFSAQFGVSRNGTFAGSVTFGPGAGIDVSRYPTKTVSTR
ncbi:MAG: hypothetical protein NVS2B8_13670 [Vulcanimicrobiaceae bacterium]